MESEKKLRLEKRVTTFRRVYYDLILDYKVIGTGWIIKKFKYFADGMHIEIIPEERKKGYGTKFVNMLEYELADLDVDVYWVKINKKNIAAIKTFDKVHKEIDKFDKIYKKGKNVIYVKTLIVE